MRFVKPLDEPMLHEVMQRYNKIITVEDGTVVGGFGSAILEFMAQHNYTAEVKILGIPDRIVEHGKPEELHRECGYDAIAIAEAVREMVVVKVESMV
jgi:1-deoxy-D-xylulose-5-phosphate synthase